MSGQQMRAEMAEQADRVHRVVQAAANQSAELTEVLATSRSVAVIGRGSSRSAGTYGVHLLRQATGRPAYLLSPAELAWGRLTGSMSGTTVVAISQSGESVEVLHAAQRAREAGAKLVVVTNSVTSPLAALVERPEHVLDCQAGVEIAVPATKSYTTTLACLLAIAASARPELLDAVADRLPALMVAQHEDVSARLDLSGSRGFLLAGEGFAETTAEEGAIKLRETLCTMVTALETSELLHGNVNSVGRDDVVIAVGADPLGAHLAGQALEQASARGAATVYVGVGEVGHAGTSLWLPDVPAHWVPFLAVQALQWAAHDTAVARQLDPDSPHGLTKITRIEASSLGAGDVHGRP
ncbi:SIS domain-containing protein [Nocardioides sp.]|uniref:SIS domain-containing protein n=1 Tax=Nocardioides sp. TaxID=35761 RepID=UPI002604C4E0|nr:SIS domain-containing protein [Nocardioides sp.]MCW2736860.1 glucosamine-6-phosphate deaminase [Nocardioides sp.]